MVVLCDGMIRSGSTWSFNVALQLVRTLDPQHRTFGLYSENPEVLFAAGQPRSSNLVIKSHRLDSSAYELCRNGPFKTIYTWRHPYDAIASAKRMFKHPVGSLLHSLRHSLGVWSFHLATNTACIISYEAIVRAPEASIKAIATYLELPVDPLQLSEIAEATSFKRARNFSRRVDELDRSRVIRRDGFVFDRQTLLHQNHIQDGRVGYGAALLSCEERSAIDAVLIEEGFGFLSEEEAAPLWLTA